MSEASSNEMESASVPAVPVVPAAVAAVGGAEAEPGALSGTLSAAPGGAQEGELVDERMWGVIAALRERGVAKKAIARQLGLDVKTVR